MPAPAAPAENELSGVQKAAILLIALGPEKSAKIFKHLKDEEIEELTLEIANTRSVTPQIKEEVIGEFYQICLAQQYIAEGGIGYAKELLEQSVKLVGVPVPFMTKEDKIRAIRYLNDAGAFLITKSGDRVSKFFGISKYTLYSYLDEAKQSSDNSES